MNDRGFTLLELLVASAIGSVVIFTLYLGFSSALSARESIDLKAERSRQLARFVDSFTREVESAYIATEDRATFFRGGLSGGPLPASSLEFTALSYPLAGQEASGDLRAVRYSIAENGRGGSALYKEVWNPFGPEDRAQKAEVMDSVLGFELAFYDGSGWSAAWDAKLEKRAPEAVRAIVRITDGRAATELRALARTLVR